MKKILRVLLLVSVSISAQAALICDWESNYGKVLWYYIQPSGVSFKLTGGETKASTTATFVLPMNVGTDAARFAMQNMMNSIVNSKEKQTFISVQTYSNTCSVPNGMPYILSVRTDTFVVR